jgi:PAS domain-containing protein
MSAKRIEPTGRESFFGDEEIIVSKTDVKGRITYANDVFLRVSHYPAKNLLGQPHSIIRHPEMPRTVFRLLWETIEAGSEIFAYVLNMAANGELLGLRPCHAELRRCRQDHRLPFQPAQARPGADRQDRAALPRAARARARRRRPQDQHEPILRSARRRPQSQRSEL